MVLSIFFLSLLLSWGLLGMGREGLGSGFSSSPEDNVWSCPAFLFVYFGCLAILYFCQVV